MDGEVLTAYSLFWGRSCAEASNCY